jgi:hypothetical protein
VKNNKDSDNDWFQIESNKLGTRHAALSSFLRGALLLGLLTTRPKRCSWSGKCWYIHEYKRYEFDLEFEVRSQWPASAAIVFRRGRALAQIPVGYPNTPFEILLPELEGKTVKMYRGGKICLTVHFKPLWAKNVPHFGIAHALAMGVHCPASLRVVRYSLMKARVRCDFSWRRGWRPRFRI